MKALLRSSLIALLVFAGYAAFSSDAHQVAGAVGRPAPAPCLPPVQGHANSCVK
jgi:hypothetical protein